MDETALKKVLDQVVKSTDSDDGKEKKTSGWKVFIYVIVALVLLAVAVIPAVLARRKAAKIAHERDKLLEEKKQAELKAKLEEDEYERKLLESQAEELRKMAEEAQKELSGLADKREEFRESLEPVTSWGDIPEWRG